MSALLAPFAERGARANAAVLRHLANAVATFGGGEPFPVLFDREGVEPFGDAVDAVQLRAGFELRHAPAIVRGSVLVIGGVSYTVDTGTEPDATGWVSVGLHPTPPAPAPAPQPPQGEGA